MPGPSAAAISLTPFHCRSADQESAGKHPSNTDAIFVAEDRGEWHGIAGAFVLTYATECDAENSERSDADGRHDAVQIPPGIAYRGSGIRRLVYRLRVRSTLNSSPVGSARVTVTLCPFMRSVTWSGRIVICSRIYPGSRGICLVFRRSLICPIEISAYRSAAACGSRSRTHSRNHPHGRSAFPAGTLERPAPGCRETRRSGASPKRWRGTATVLPRGSRCCR